MIRVFGLLIVLTRFAWAVGGDVGGNGGDLVVCDLSGGQSSYELLDFYEAARQTPPAPFELGRAGWDAGEKVAYALDRLRTVDPVRAARYEAEAKAFLSLVEWITQGPGLEHIPDLGQVAIPPQCKVRQIAIRRKTFHPSIRPFLIDERLWLKLDEDHKAGLILHEIVYGHMRDLGQRDSLNARAFNGLLSSSAFQSISLPDYKRLVKALFVEIQPIAFRADKFDVNALEGQTFALNLRSLLQYPVKGILEWRFLDPLPKWMTFNDVTETITGVPDASSPAPHLLTLVVHDENAGAIAQLRVHIK